MGGSGKAVVDMALSVEASCHDVSITVWRDALPVVTPQNLSRQSALMASILNRGQRMKGLKDHLRVNGKHLEIAWHGPAPEEAPTLVFLHEGLGCVALWRDFPAKLAAATGCGALIYSRLGYGRSDRCELPRPLRFMHDEGLHVLPAILDLAGVRQCVLIGHSDGGSIAIIYAGGVVTESLRGVIAEAPHVFCEEMTVRSIRKAKEAYASVAVAIRDVQIAIRSQSDIRHHIEWSSRTLHGSIPGFESSVRRFVLLAQGPQQLALRRENPHGVIEIIGAIDEIIGANVNPVSVREYTFTPGIQEFSFAIKDDDGMSAAVKGVDTIV